MFMLWQNNTSEQTQIGFKYVMHVEQNEKTINGKEQSQETIFNVVRQTYLHSRTKMIKNFH